MSRLRRYLLLLVCMTVYSIIPSTNAAIDHRSLDINRIKGVLGDAMTAGPGLYGESDFAEAAGPDVMAAASAATSVTEYRGNIIYRDGKVWMVLFPGGYATLEGGTVTFHYYTQDYLGNIRAVTNGTTGAIEQTIAYYPFGGVIADMGSPQGGQPFRFGGKELVTANGLNEYDFGARQYWQAVPHFTRIDPLCEVSYHLSPYLFCGNDPVNKVDPSGMIFTDESQKYLDKFMSNIESRIQANKNKIAVNKADLDKSDLSNKKKNKIQRGIAKLEGANILLEAVKNEITTLQESTQVYNIYMDNSINISGDLFGNGGETRGGVKYNETTEMFDIILGDDSLGILAHELKHAYQFESGDFSSGYNITGLPFYDQTDEVEAYERGAIFGQSKINSFQSMYGQFQKAASGVKLQNEAIQNSCKALQNIADRTKSTFRWNGITYRHN